jgi:hypothetical protein
VIGWRKYSLAMYFGTGCFVLCYTGHMAGTEVVGAISILAGLYKWSNVVDKKNGGAG